MCIRDRFIFFTHNSDVVVCTIHCRTHKIDCTRIYTDVFFVSMFLMDFFCDKSSIRSQHKTAQLGINCNIPHSCRNKNFFIYLTYALSDHTDIIWCLLWSVRDGYKRQRIS